MKYWAYMNGEVPGSYTPQGLTTLPGFDSTTLVCPAEGEIAEKNWRRAGEFADIARALEDREKLVPPPPPAATREASAAAAAAQPGVDALIDASSTRLFSHVADLMKELEGRREEKALTASLQKQVAVLKEELARTRERADLLETRLPRIAELEEAQRKDHSALQSLQESLHARETALNETRIAGERLRSDLDAAKRRLQETANDLAMRNKLVDKLSRELSDKELSLAKSLGVIRRLEEDLNRLCPDPAALAAPAEPTPAPLSSAPPPPPAPLPSADDAGFTRDDPPPTPPYLEPPPDTPKAHQALLGKLRKIFPGQNH
jgi:hypothetical protein